MPCSICQRESVINLRENKKSLCKRHFLSYFERKVLKTIRNFSLVDEDDFIAVAVSGGKDSLTTLYLLKQLQKKNPKMTISALLIDEGISGYRDKTIIDAKDFCEKYKIDLKIASFEKEVGKRLDNLVQKFRPCSVCGVMRRYLLNKYANELGATKLATGHNLDDEAQSIMMNQLRGDWARTSRLGPITSSKSAKLVPRIKPLYFMSEKEVTVYTILKGFQVNFSECPHAGKSYRADVRDMLNTMENSKPGTKSAIVQSFLQILPMLKEKYSGMHNSCTACGEPSSHNICKKCQMMEAIND